MGKNPEFQVTKHACSFVILTGTASQSALASAINFKCLFLYANIYMFRARVGFSFFLLPFFLFTFPNSFFFRLSDSLNPYPLKLMTILCRPRLWRCNTALANLCSLSRTAWRRTSHWRRASCTLSKPAAVTWTAKHLALHGRHEVSFQWCRLTLFPSLLPEMLECTSTFLQLSKMALSKTDLKSQHYWEQSQNIPKIRAGNKHGNRQQIGFKPGLVIPHHCLSSSPQVEAKHINWSTLIEPVHSSFVQLSHLCLGQPSALGQKPAATGTNPTNGRRRWVISISWSQPWKKGFLTK